MGEILNAYAGVMNYVGRANRKEYLRFILFQLIVYGFSASIYFIGEGSVVSVRPDLPILSAFGALFGIVFSIVSFFPFLSLVARRLHDTDRTALWLLLCFVPMLGPVCLFILSILPGTIGENRFGSPSF